MFVKLKATKTGLFLHMLHTLVSSTHAICVIMKIKTKVIYIHIFAPSQNFNIKFITFMAKIC